MSQPAPDLSELLIELAATTDMSAEAVAQAIEAYPAQRDEILRFAIEWHAGVESDDSDVPPLPAPDLSAFGFEPIIDPFAGKTSAELNAAAAACDIPISILIKLEQRSIDVGTVPLLLLRSLSAFLGTQLNNLLGFLSLDPTLSTSASYRSDKPPEVAPRVSFASAIRSTKMDEAQRTRWLALIE
ncbi:hypothetical protein NKI51_23430 [Mesorhizobium australicum]|uniref:hypothetical protein n=1 Tax=Mesorhizobium australicum TaxID=536018 RepID=UPI00333BD083